MVIMKPSCRVRILDDAVEAELYAWDGEGGSIHGTAVIEGVYFHETLMQAFNKCSCVLYQTFSNDIFCMYARVGEKGEEVRCFHGVEGVIRVMLLN